MHCLLEVVFLGLVTITFSMFLVSLKVPEVFSCWATWPPQSLRISSPCSKHLSCEHYQCDAHGQSLGPGGAWAVGGRPHQTVFADWLSRYHAAALIGCYFSVPFPLFTSNLPFFRRTRVDIELILIVHLLVLGTGAQKGRVTWTN